MFAAPHPRMSLQREGLYGWTMYPGYGGDPYFSPIMVYEITPLGRRTFELTFLNMFYAAGVQRMTYLLRTLRREENYIIAEELRNQKTTDRVAILEPLSRRWLRRSNSVNEEMLNTLFKPSGEPVRDAFLGLVSSA